MLIRVVYKWMIDPLSIVACEMRIGMALESGKFHPTAHSSISSAPLPLATSLTTKQLQ